MQRIAKQLRRSGEFLDAARELDYRRQQLTAERRQLRVLWLLALLFFMLYGIAEYAGAVHSPGWHWGYLPRLFILLTGMLVLVVEGSVTETRQRDMLACCALFVVGLCYALDLAWRSDDGNPLGAVILLVCGMYLFSPGRFTLVCASGLFCSASTGIALLLPLPESRPLWLAVSYLIPTNLLAALALAQLNRLRRVECLQREQLQRQIQVRKEMAAQLQRAHKRNQQLLYNALPADIARKLAQNPGCPIAEYHASATVLFVDLVNFSAISQACSAQELVYFLDQLFTRFDSLARSHGVEKIKTLGDAWMGVAGLGDSDQPGLALASILGLALEQLRVAQNSQPMARRDIQLRIGVHSGSLVAGVIGQQRYAFDVWGETVNIASRLQAAARPGRILVSTASSSSAPASFLFGPERQFQLKGCGVVHARNFYGQGLAASGELFRQLSGDESGTVLRGQV